METSDSECFESADEEFYSDDESAKTVKHVAKNDPKQEEKLLEKTISDFSKKVNLNETQIKKSNQTEDVNENPNLLDMFSKKETENKCKKEVETKDEQNNVTETAPTATKLEDTQEEESGDSKGEEIKVKKSGLKIINRRNRRDKKPVETPETVKIVSKTEPIVDPQPKIVEKKVETSRNVLETVSKHEEKQVVETNLSKNTYVETVVATPPNAPENVSKHEKKQVREENSLKIIKNSSKAKKTIESPQIVAKQEEKPVVEEENLWDEEEIDWGKEEMLNKKDEEEKPKAAKPLDKPVEKEDNMWEDDDWEPIEHDETQKKPQTNPIDSNEGGWGAWGTWGVTSILNTASHSVTTITNQVSQGISTVLETGMGVPDPEELARINKQEQEKLQQKLQEMSQNKTEEAAPETPKHMPQNQSGFGLGNFVSGVTHLTKLVETTGTKVISGGLDTLETIGKKTMQVLQDGDPGLKRKRAFLNLEQNKPVLSQVLRDAKEKSEQENKALEEKHFRRKLKNYETVFDDHQGLVHLEALEMLSKQCDIKLQCLGESLTGDALTEMQETMEQVKELCELPDEDEDEHVTVSEIKEKLVTAVAEINIQITYDRLNLTWDETELWLNSLKLEVCDERELHQQAIETLALITAIAVEQFHKAGELLLVKEHRSTADEADSLVQLTTTLTTLIGIVAAKFSDKLNAKASDSKNKETVNSLITNVFFEAANSSSYLQDAFQLLIPVLQVGAV